MLHFYQCTVRRLISFHDDDDDDDGGGAKIMKIGSHLTKLSPIT